MAMTLVSTVTVGSGGAASIEFTNIPQTGKDLLLLLSSRESSTNLSCYFKPNGQDTNLTNRTLSGTGSTTASQSLTGIDLFSTRSSDTANTFSNNSLYVTNYAGSSAKSVSIDRVTENNATQAFQTIVAGLWNDTAAITSFRLDASDGFVQHTSASLYIIS